MSQSYNLEDLDKLTKEELIDLVWELHLRIMDLELENSHLLKNQHPTALPLDQMWRNTSIEMDLRAGHSDKDIAKQHDVSMRIVRTIRASMGGQRKAGRPKKQ
jgi:hypothetical protein